MRTDPDPDALELPRAVRNACVQAALDGYERAQIAGLCQEGAWECRHRCDSHARPRQKALRLGR
jgi:hypothetical protein